MSTRRVQTRHLMSRGWQECMQPSSKAELFIPTRTRPASVDAHRSVPCLRRVRGCCKAKDNPGTERREQTIAYPLASLLGHVEVRSGKRNHAEVQRRK